MKNIRIVILSIMVSMLSVSCASTNDQEQPLLVGEISKEQLFNDTAIFSNKYQNFTPTELSTEQVKKWPEGLQVDIYFGTWCHDSQREVPRFLKLVANDESLNYQLIALDYKKLDPQGLSTADKVKYTPTFVVKLNGKEIGRIVERTNKSYGEDIYNMLLKANLL